MLDWLPCRMRALRPPRYVTASVAVSLGGFLNGYDTGSIGAIMEMPQFASTFGHLEPFMVGFSVSLIMLTGAVPSVFAGYLADRLGRIKAMLIGAVLFGIGAAIQGSAFVLPQLLVGRTLSGLGEGVYLSNMAVYICEIVPLKHRGILAGLPQFMSAAGVCAGYFTSYGSINIPSDIAWRLLYIVQVAVSTVFVASLLQLPDSPRWLMMNNMRDKAKDAVQRLDYTMAEARRDFLEAVDHDAEQVKLSFWQSLVILFRRAYRLRTFLALFVLGMVQLSGIDAVLYYAPVLFSQAGLTSNNASFLASGVSAILMLAISVPAFLLSDSWGRRTSVLTGGVLLSGTMFLIGSLYASGIVHPEGAARWVVIVAVFVFSLTYCATWAIVGKIYASEIQPIHTRATANCVAQGLNFFTNWFVAMIAPILLDKSAYGAYFLFGGLALFTVVVLAIYMPETKGRSLEDIQKAFQQPSITSNRSWNHLRRRPGAGTRGNSQSSIDRAGVLRDGSVAEHAATGAGSSMELQHVASGYAPPR